MSKIIRLSKDGASEDESKYLNSVSDKIEEFYDVEKMLHDYTMQSITGSVAIDVNDYKKKQGE